MRRFLLLLAALALAVAACSGDANASGDSGGAPEITTAPVTTAPAIAATPDVAAPEAVEPSEEAETEPEAVEPAEPVVQIESGAVLVSADEIEAALSGNTVVGNWVGEDYRQFFDPSGETIYLPDGGNISNGQWRVNVQSGQYESLWPSDPAWDTYDVLRDGDQWYWTGGGVVMSPFTVLEGNQLP